MEDFERILNDYLNEEEMKEKFEQDILEIKTPKKNNKSKGNDFVQTISISDFVSCYLGTLHDCSQLKHQGLKSFKNPYVVGVSNNFALKNPDCVIRNEILVVIDAFGNPGSYINPDLLKNIETMEECKRVLKLLKQIKIHNFNNLEKVAHLHKLLLIRIEDLEQTYINSCDLLKTLSKEHLLKEIKSYVKKIHETSDELEKEISNVDNIIDLEEELLNHDVFKKHKVKKKKSK